MTGPDVPLNRKRFTVAQFELLGRTGILRSDDRVELIEGEILVISPASPAHLAQVNRLTHRLIPLVGTLAQVSAQNPIVLSRSEPQPDIVLLRPRPDFYTSGLPQAADVLLLVEVSDTTAEVDRQVKVPLYGRSGIVESWLVDLKAKTIEVYREPTPMGYHLTQICGTGDRLSLGALPGLSLTADEILS